MNPLNALHEKAGAEFQPYADISIVGTFGQPQAEYAAIRTAAAIMDQPHRGTIVFTGKDRLTFLNNLLTNQIYDKQRGAGLSPFSGLYAFLLDPKGRIVSDMNVLELGNRTLLDVDARMVRPLMETFERYRFREQVALASLLESVRHLFLTGPLALEALNGVFEPRIGQLGPLGAAAGRMLGCDVVVYRDDACGSPGYAILCPTAAAETIWSHLAPPPAAIPAPVGPGQARPFGWAVFNTTRIEAARPLFGIDFDHAALPPETGQLARGVSLTKGCYPGQEIVTRMHTRGQVARQIAGIRMDGDELPIAGNAIFDDQDNQVGVVTSSTISPILSNAAICLGMVSKPLFAVGSRLRIPAEGQIRPARVVQIPFVPPTSPQRD